MAAQLRAVDLRELDAAEQDAPGARVVEAGEQLRERRLARAGRADERGHGAGLEREVDALQRGVDAVVGEPDALEAHLVACRAAGRGGRGQRRRGEQRLQAAGGLAAELQLAGGVAQRDDRPRQPDAEHGEDDELGALQPALGDEQRAGGEDDRQARRRRRDDLGRGRQPEQAAHPPPEGLREVVGGVGEAPVRAAGLPERLDDADAMDELDRRRVDARQRRVVGGDLAGVAAHLQRVQREAGDERYACDEREAPVDPAEVGDRQQRRDDRGRQVREGVRDEVVQRRDVVGHRLLDRAGVARREPAQRHAAEVLDEPPLDRQLQVGVGEVVEARRGEQAGEPHDERGGPCERGRPRGVSVQRLAQQRQADLGDRDERRDARRRADRVQRAGERDAAAHRREQVGELAHPTAS